MANEDYKNGKLVEIVREFNNTGNQYEVNGIKQAIAVPFWRRENDKFQVIPKGSYSFINEAGNDYLKILDSTILQQATQFQIVYDYLQLSSKYIEDFPDVVILTEKYNQLVDDTSNIFSYLKSVGMTSDTLQLTKVLAQLEPLTTWYMNENGEIKALPISELYGKFNQMVEALKKEFEKVLIAGADEALIEIIKKFKEETDKQLGILAGAGSAFKPKQVANIEILKNVNAKVDEVYEVLGYHRFDDGAIHKRKIAREDDGSGVQLANGMWANIIHNGEIHVDWFGTIGDGRNEQPLFTKISNYIKQQPSLKMKIIFPYGKTFEYGDQIINPSPKTDTNYYITIDGFYFRDSKRDLELEFDFNYCKFIRKSNLHYGAFNPLTGEKHNSSGEFLGKGYGITCPSLINTGLIGSFVAYNATIDGNNLNDVIGGTFGDKGRQLTNNGLNLTCKKFIELSNIKVSNMHLDGISADGTTEYNSYEYTKIKDCYITRCGRMGLTTVGGQNISVRDTEITYCGTNNLPCSSAPKAGWDIENESGSFLKNIKLYNVHIEECGSSCLTSDTQSSSEIYLYNSKLLNRNGLSFYISSKNVEIHNCILAGQNQKNIRVKFYNCIFTDDLTPYTILNELDNKVNKGIGYYLEYAENVFDCTFIFNNENVDLFYGCTLTNAKIYSKFPITQYYNKFLGNTLCKVNNEQIPLGIGFIQDTIKAKNINYLYNSNTVETKFVSNLAGENFLRGSIVYFYQNPKYLCCVCLRGGRAVKTLITDNADAEQGSNRILAHATKDKWIQMSSGSVIDMPSAFDTEVVIVSNEWLGEDQIEIIVDKNAGRTIKGGELSYPEAVLKYISFDKDDVLKLDTSYYSRKMEKEGVLQDFDAYLDEKKAYDKQQEKIEKDIQLAYQDALKENPNLTYEQFMSVQPMTLNLVEEPQPSEALKKFMEKYL